MINYFAPAYVVNGRMYEVTLMTSDDLILKLPLAVPHCKKVALSSTGSCVGSCFFFSYVDLFLSFYRIGLCYNNNLI